MGHTRRQTPQWAFSRPEEIIAEVVKQEKWIEIGRGAEAKRATQVHAGALKRWLDINSLT